MSPLPEEVRRVIQEFGLPATGARGARAPSGLIQVTWLVTLADGRPLVVQRIHPAFKVEVLLDIEAVTAHLARAGLETPRLRRAASGALHVLDADGMPWRIYDCLDGTTVDRVTRPAIAAAAGALVARFHLALADLAHEFCFVRSGVHDTAAHLARLEAALGGEPARALGAEGSRLARLGAAILDEARRLPPLAAAALPRRVTHGDLKISNVLFAVPPGEGPIQARALIDLDTLGRQTLAYELGDAWRSWCNPLGEDVEQTSFDLEVFRAAVGSYAASAGALLTCEERESLVPGIQTVALELAARFCVDAFEDRYFGWDPARFPCRREHNRVRAAGQLALARAVAAVRGEAAAIVAAAFGAPGRATAARACPRA